MRYYITFFLLFIIENLLAQITLPTFHGIQKPDPPIPFVNYALSFDGVNDHINTGGTTISSNWSAEVWFKKSAQKNVHNFTNKSFSNAGSNNWSLRLGQWQNTKKIGISKYGYADFYINNSSANTDVGKWEHVAWTYSGTNLKVYVNGEFIGSFYHEYSNGPANTSNISNAKLMTKYIGYNSSATIHGEIDEVRFWNDKRTASEIADNMFIELNGDEAGLVAYYKMTNGTGTTLTDNSSNSYNGTLKNMNNNDWVTSYAPIGNLNNDYRNSIKAIWAKTSTSQYSLSSNGLFFKIDAALTEQNFVVFGNNNLSSTSTSNLPVGVVKRSNRIWHLYESGTVETNVIFDISDVTGNNATVGAASNYKLLYRSGTSGDFSTVKTADNIINTDNVVFSSVDLNDGYYCIGVTQNNGL